MRLKVLILIIVSLLSSILFTNSIQAEPKQKVSVIEMDMMILPGTASFLEQSIERAKQDQSAVLVVKLDTPGGILNTSQEMVQSILNSDIPIVVYVSPAGGTATSAGVFLTLAAHVAVMAPGTSIGAAHPVAGDGKDIEGDLRTKAENITVAMVKSIAEQRGRNLEWAEKAVKESASLTESEAVKQNVIDFVASDLDQLLKQLNGKQIVLGDTKFKLDDYSALPRVKYEIDFRSQLVNVFANPNVAALLWLGASTGLSLELYNPGAILPGMVGAICLILALLVSQIIPVSQGAILLIVLGGLLIGAELYVASGILGLGGLVSMILGVLYFVDLEQAPGLTIAFEYVLPVVVLIAGLMFLVVRTLVKDLGRPKQTGKSGLVGLQGKVVQVLSPTGKVFVNGEYWSAEKAEGVAGVIQIDQVVEVVEVRSGMLLSVRPVEQKES